MPDIVVTGVGITTAVGQGRQAVSRALKEQRHAFAIMRQPGRQTLGSRFIGAEIGEIETPRSIGARTLRAISRAATIALTTAHEAWHDAGLDDMDPERIGLVVGGSNLQQRDILLLQEQYRDNPGFLRPQYGMMFLDTDIAGLCAQELGAKGFAYTVAAASASGHLAVIRAAEAVASGQVDACLAVGAPTDISHWECQGFRALGAMGSDLYADDPPAACRPFDEGHDGFIYGESCGALVLERQSPVRPVKAYARLPGWSVVSDAHRNPDPSQEGEERAIAAALARSALAPAEIDYVNTHGTGSRLGDRIELDALKSCGLGGAYLNATKSIVGHGLSAAGAVELVATILQMEGGFVHATRNLENPVDPDFAWVVGGPVAAGIRSALNLSFGFGGISSAICLTSTH